ncbi:MAG TPA: transcriptional repressor LexA [Phycisphaerae bacterium]|nr:transcriptional repressor LexA [Phycisphaerae bacterium]HNU44995.1 transcriptional repressor LexA [Phycisphaerae bacterium]
MARTGKAAPESAALTPRQLEILTRIRDDRRRNGYSPTLQEIADSLGRSKVTVFEHVEALVRKGLLRRQRNKARSLDLTSAARLPDERPTRLPLVGRIAAGRPLEAVETPDAVDLEEMFQSRYPVCALRVTGDSMVDDQIRDGDLVVFEQRSNPRNGDTVVALLDREEATLKRFYRERDRIRLQPANDRYPPLYVKDRDLAIQGVVIGVLRRL